MRKIILLATLAFVVLAGTAANAAEISSKRAAALKDCSATSKQPRGKYYDWDGGWDVQYGGCMHRHGEAP